MGVASTPVTLLLFAADDHSSTRDWTTGSSHPGLNVGKESNKVSNYALSSNWLHEPRALSHSRNHVAPLPHVEDHASPLPPHASASAPPRPPSQWETARGVTRRALNGILEKRTQVLTPNLSLWVAFPFVVGSSCSSSSLYWGRLCVSSFAGQRCRFSTATGSLCLVFGSATLTTPARRFIHPLQPAAAAPSHSPRWLDRLLQFVRREPGYRP